MIEHHRCMLWALFISASMINTAFYVTSFIHQCIYEWPSSLYVVRFIHQCINDWTSSLYVMTLIH